MSNIVGQKWSAPSPRHCIGAPPPNGASIWPTQPTFFVDKFFKHAVLLVRGVSRCSAKMATPQKPEVSSTSPPCLTQTGEGWCLTPLVFACDASKEDARRQGRTAWVGVLGSGGRVKRGRYWQLIGQLLGCAGELRSQTPREPHANWSISAGRLLFSAQKARSKGRRARGWGGR